MFLNSWLVPSDGEKEVCPVQELQENKMYSKGNHQDLNIFFQKQTDQDTPKVITVTVVVGSAYNILISNLKIQPK